MTARRAPLSFEAAITKVCRALGGTENAAKRLGIAKSTVDSWQNPGRNALPTLSQAAVLDAHYVHATGDPLPSPIAAALVAQVGRDAGRQLKVKLLDEAMAGQAAANKIVQDLLPKVRQGSLGTATDLSEHERDALREAAADAINALLRLSAGLQVFPKVEPLVEYMMVEPDSAGSGPEKPRQPVATPPKRSAFGRWLFGDDV